MSRIISGKYRGFRLQMPPGTKTRPTGERFKESLFSILLPELPGARFLDAFAGSGQIGLEALSRGASQVTFVEADRRAVKTLEGNLATLGLERDPCLEVYPCRLEQALPQLVKLEKTYDLIYLDPPWKHDEAYRRLGQVLAQGQLLTGRTQVVTESDVTKPCPFDALIEDHGLPFTCVFERSYGAARLKIYEEEA